MKTNDYAGLPRSCKARGYLVYDKCVETTAYVFFFRRFGMHTNTHAGHLLSCVRPENTSKEVGGCGLGVAICGPGWVLRDLWVYFDRVRCLISLLLVYEVSLLGERSRHPALQFRPLLVSGYSMLCFSLRAQRKS